MHSAGLAKPPGYIRRAALALVSTSFDVE